MTDTFDLDRLVTLPRLSDLRCSPDGSRLVVTVDTPGPDGRKLLSSLWEVDPAGIRAPRRLTRSGAGECSGAFLPDGSLLFTSARPDPDAREEDPKREKSALWLLPGGGGEARQLLAPEGGVEDLRTARHARTVAMAAKVYRDADTLEADAARAKARKDAGVSALLFETYPIRHWDHYIGPRERHLLVAAIPESDTEPVPAPRDLTPDAGAALEERSFDISPDGRTAVASMLSRDIHRPVGDLVAFDVATGERRMLTPGDASYDQPAFSPDGRSIACVRTTLGDPATAGEQRLWLLDAATGAGRDLAPAADLWPNAPAWSPDGSAVFFLADQDGQRGDLPRRGRVRRRDVPRGGRHPGEPRGLAGRWNRLRPAIDAPRAQPGGADRGPGGWTGAGRHSLAGAGRVGGRVAGPRRADRGHRGRRGARRRVARAAARCVGRSSGAAGGVRPRRPAGLLDRRLALALEPTGACGTRLRRAAARPGVLARATARRSCSAAGGSWSEAPFTDMLATVDAAVARPDVDATRAGR